MAKGKTFLDSSAAGAQHLWQAVRRLMDQGYPEQEATRMVHGDNLNKIDMSLMPFDPRFTSSVAGGKPRTRQAQAVLDSIYERELRNMLPVENRSIVDFEGRPFVTSMSDRTAAGGLLTKVNDVEFDNPVNLRGGQDYMRDNEGKVWASARGPVQDIYELSARMKQEFGQDPVFIPWRMAPTGNDFSNMGVDTMVQYALKALPASQLKDLDKIIKTDEKKLVTKTDKKTGRKTEKLVPIGIPDWPSFTSDNLLSFTEKMSGDQRKLLADILDKQAFGNYGKGGGLSVAQARTATTDPYQYTALQGGIQNVGQLDLSRMPQYDPSHPSYPFSLAGDYVGTIREDVPIWGLLDPENIYKQTKAEGFTGYSRPSVGGRTSTPSDEDLRSLQMGARGGVIDENALKWLQSQGIISARPETAIMAGLLGAGAMMAPQDAEAGVLRNVFPAPQRFFDPEDKAFKPFLGQQFEPQAGGRYLQMGDGAPKDITGEYPDYGMLSISPDGKPSFKISDVPADISDARTGRKIKTNLFKRKAGWQWTQAPEGFDPNPAGDFPLISVQDGKQHYYTLATEFPKGVELARYEKSATEPRLRPTRQGVVELGNVVGEISVRGKKHPVYDRATVKSIAPVLPSSGNEAPDLVEERVQGLMSAIAQEQGYVYGDILPIKRSQDPAAREEFPYGFEPAVPNVARGLIEELIRAYELNRAGRTQEAAQSAVGVLL